MSVKARGHLLRIPRACRFVKARGLVSRRPVPCLLRQCMVGSNARVDFTPCSSLVGVAGEEWVVLPARQIGTERRKRATDEEERKRKSRLASLVNDPSHFTRIELSGAAARTLASFVAYHPTVFFRQSISLLREKKGRLACRAFYNLGFSID